MSRIPPVSASRQSSDERERPISAADFAAFISSTDLDSPRSAALGRRIFDQRHEWLAGVDAQIYGQLLNAGLYHQPDIRDADLLADLIDDCNAAQRDALLPHALPFVRDAIEAWDPMERTDSASDFISRLACSCLEGDATVFGDVLRGLATMPTLRDHVALCTLAAIVCGGDEAETLAATLEQAVAACEAQGVDLGACRTHQTARVAGGGTIWNLVLRAGPVAVDALDVFARRGLLAISDDTKQTALHLALSQRCTTTARALLELPPARALLTERDAAGATPTEMLLELVARQQKELDALDLRLSRLSAPPATGGQPPAPLAGSVGNFPNILDVVHAAWDRDDAAWRLADARHQEAADVAAARHLLAQERALGQQLLDWVGACTVLTERHPLADQPGFFVRQYVATIRQLRDAMRTFETSVLPLPLEVAWALSERLLAPDSPPVEPAGLQTLYHPGLSTILVSAFMRGLHRHAENLAEAPHRFSDDREVLLRICRLVRAFLSGLPDMLASEPEKLGRLVLLGDLDNACSQGYIQCLEGLVDGVSPAKDFPSVARAALRELAVTTVGRVVDAHLNATEVTDVPAHTLRPEYIIALQDDLALRGITILQNPGTPAVASAPFTFIDRWIRANAASTAWTLAQALVGAERINELAVRGATLSIEEASEHVAEFARRTAASLQIGGPAPTYAEMEPLNALLFSVERPGSAFENPDARIVLAHAEYRAVAEQFLPLPPRDASPDDVAEFQRRLNALEDFDHSQLVNNLQAALVGVAANTALETAVRSQAAQLLVHCVQIATAETSEASESPEKRPHLEG